MFSIICTWINGWVNNGQAGDLRRHRAHYDVTVMQATALLKHLKCPVFCKSAHPSQLNLFLFFSWNIYERRPWSMGGKRWVSFVMMTSSNGTIFRVTGPLWGEPLVIGGFPHKGSWHDDLVFSLTWAWINGSANNRDAGDLRRHCVHYDVTTLHAISCLMYRHYADDTFNCIFSNENVCIPIKMSPNVCS